MIRVSAADSAAIRIVRVLCIFRMMSVHLVPGPFGLSFVTRGAGSALGLVWLDFLGRASVATLSLVSGFLLASRFETQGILQIARDRGRAVVVPMMVWNGIGLLAVLTATLAGIRLSEVRLEDVASPLGPLDGITGLFGPTLNLSLFFLRDLFVASVLLALFWPVLRRRIGLALAVVLLLTVCRATAPVIFRPSILLFMLAGCALRARGFGLDRLAAPRLALPGAAVALAVFAACLVLGGTRPEIVEIRDIARRALLVFGVLALAFALGRRPKVQAVFDRLEPVAFLAYLGHALLAKVIWLAMAAAGVTLAGPSYLVYFLGAPVLVFLIALAARPAIEALPAPLPLLLKGKAAPPRPAPSPAGPASSPGPAS